MPRDIKDWISKQSLANFSYGESVTGRSYLRYYGGNTYATAYILSGENFYSNDVYSVVGIEKKVFNFDIAATSTFVADGDAIISCEISKTAKSSPSSECRISGSIVRIRDGTETVVAPEVLLAFKGTATAAVAFRLTEKIACNRTRFKKGDTLRYVISMHVKGSNDNWELYHDPQNRQGNLPAATDPSTLDMYLPLNVNV